MGMNKVVTLPGYWRANDKTDLITECPNKQACLGGTLNQTAGICADGYQGILCGDCS